MIPNLFILLFAIIVNVEEWKLEKDKDGIKVSTRKSESSPLKDSKVEGEIGSPVEDIVSIIMDFESYPEWVPTCVQAYTLKEEGNSEVYYYAEYKAPWPVSNRDMIVHTKVIEVEEGVRIDMKAAPRYIPEKVKKVRIPEFNGYWLIKDIGIGSSYAINEVHTHPGGNIPAWLANIAADTPFKTFKALREKLNNLKED